MKAAHASARRLVFAAALWLGLTALPAVAQSVPSTLPGASEGIEGEIPASGIKTKPERVVVVRMRDGLQFDPSRFTADPGEKLTLQLENADTTGMTHNFLLLKPGRREDVVKAAAALGDQGPTQNFIPKSADVLISSPVLALDGTNNLRVTMPAEKGIYPYVCTFPGHGLVMYGAAYVGLPMPNLANDKNVPPTSLHSAVPGQGKRPFVQRIFMPDAGPAAIAVALEGNDNFCWDADECRIRYAWKGNFVDAGDHWAGKGGQLAVVPNRYWWADPAPRLALRLGEKQAARPSVKFLGYSITAQGPVFHYRLDGVEVFEQIVPAHPEPGLTLQFRIPAAEHDVYYEVPPAEKTRWKSSVGGWESGVLHLTAEQAKQFALTVSSPADKP